MAKNEIKNILLAENNLSHIRLYLAILQDTYNNYNLNCVQNETDAISFLQNKNEPRPDIILMAMNLAYDKNLKLLRFIKENDSLKTIPVIVLSESPTDEEITKCYEHNANFVIKKPRDKSDFILIVSIIEMLFLDYSKLPS